jgi:hypothetical protein
MPSLKPGLRLKSAVCDGEAMIVKAIDVTLTCGGVPMVATSRCCASNPVRDPSAMTATC